VLGLQACTTTPGFSDFFLFLIWMSFIYFPDCPGNRREVARMDTFVLFLILEGKYCLLL
jgi:hypothetical protein